jgi:Domain of unknown function (DUF4232)
MRSQRSLGMATVLALCIGLVTSCTGQKPTVESPRGEGTTPNRSAAGGASAAASPCQPANVRLTPTTEVVKNINRVRLVLANTGPQACTLHGAPTVNLFGPDDPVFGPEYQLPQAKGDDFPTVTLRPGEQAHATIQYLDDAGGVNRVWSPTRMEVALPDTTGSLTTHWPGKPMARLDAATRPGTWAGPVMPGAAGEIRPGVE